MNEFKIGDMVLPAKPDYIRKVYEDYPFYQSKKKLGLDFADGMPLMVVNMRGNDLVLNTPENYHKVDTEHSLWVNSSDCIPATEQPKPDDLMALL